MAHGPYDAYSLKIMFFFEDNSKHYLEFFIDTKTRVTMGWFWADTEPVVASGPTFNSPDLNSNSVSPPPKCPAHKNPHATTYTLQKLASGCPVKHDTIKDNASDPAMTPSASQQGASRSAVSALNPLNWMPANLSQDRESAFQTMELSKARELSTIPRGANHSGDEEGVAEKGKWVYPSPQQMYNALVRKGYTDTPQDAMDSMVAVHNFLNEGAWAEIVEWERRFAPGLVHGWKTSRFGEMGSLSGASIGLDEEAEVQPKLLRFMGRSTDLTPKARLMQVMSYVYPSAFDGQLPFDRHDWYIERPPSSEGLAPKQVRYVIDYYSGPPEPSGEPVFYLDIRPALDRPSAVAERLTRWGRDVFWRASGGQVRLENRMREKLLTKENDVD